MTGSRISRQTPITSTTSCTKLLSFLKLFHSSQLFTLMIQFSANISKTRLVTKFLNSILLNTSKFLHLNRLKSYGAINETFVSLNELFKFKVYFNM